MAFYDLGAWVNRGVSPAFLLLSLGLFFLALRLRSRTLKTDPTATPQSQLRPFKPIYHITMGRTLYCSNPSPPLCRTSRPHHHRRTLRVPRGPAAAARRAARARRARDSRRGGWPHAGALHPYRQPRRGAVSRHLHSERKDSHEPHHGSDVPTRPGRRRGSPATSTRRNGGRRPVPPPARRRHAPLRRVLLLLPERVRPRVEIGPRASGHPRPCTQLRAHRAEHGALLQPHGGGKARQAGQLGCADARRAVRQRQEVYEGRECKWYSRYRNGKLNEHS